VYVQRTAYAALAALSPPPVAFLLLQSPPTTAFYPLSLHDALPISIYGHTLLAPATAMSVQDTLQPHQPCQTADSSVDRSSDTVRSEEHTSELQSRENLVCRLLLEKKNKSNNNRAHNSRATAGIR